MDIKDDVESRMRDVRARLSQLNSTLDRVDSLFVPADTAIYRQRSAEQANQRLHASNASDDFLIRERPANISLNSSASTKKGVESNVKGDAFRPAPYPSTEKVTVKGVNENTLRPSSKSECYDRDDVEHFDAYRAIQERLRRKMEALEQRRHGSIISCPAPSSVPTYKGSTLTQQKQSEQRASLTESSPPPRPPAVVDTTDVPSPDTPERAASVGTALPEGEMSPLSDETATIIEATMTPLGPPVMQPKKEEATAAALQTESVAADDFVLYHSRSPSVHEKKNAPPFTIAAPTTAVQPPQADKGPHFAKPTVSAKVRQQSASVDRAGVVPRGYMPPTTPTIPSEMLQNLQAQMPSATIAVTVTGAELFALLRLRGLIISFGETNEQLLKERECHVMFLTTSEYEQLVELRSIVRSHSSSQARRSASSAPSEAVEPRSATTAARSAATARVATTTRSAQARGKPTGSMAARRISSVYRPSERPLFAPPPKSAVQPMPWVE